VGTRRPEARMRGAPAGKRPLSAGRHSERGTPRAPRERHPASCERPGSPCETRSPQPTTITETVARAVRPPSPTTV
jgi:hypothetical protein